MTEKEIEEHILNIYRSLNVIQKALKMLLDESIEKMEKEIMFDDGAEA